MRHDDAIIVIVFDVVEETHTVGGREILFRLEKRKHNLVAKLEKVEHAIKSRTDDVVDFKQMGLPVRSCIVRMAKSIFRAFWLPSEFPNPATRSCRSLTRWRKTSKSYGSKARTCRGRC